MKSPLRYGLFMLACLAQLAAPFSLVWKHEATRAEGTLWRFQTAPVDPADPFRGRYVRLGYAVERQALPLPEAGYRSGSADGRLYAEVSADAQGFAQLGRLHRARPDGGDYLDVFVARMDYDERGAKPKVYVRLPFDRYYLPEALAPEIERRYAQAGRSARDKTYVEVRVREGHAALTALVLDGQPVLP